MRKLLTILLAMAVSVPQASAVGYEYRQQEENLGFCWQYDDMCGILTEKNTEIIHWVVTGDNSSCTLSAYGWGLAPDARYYAYYPYSKSYSKEMMTALPVCYAGQMQNDNNSAAHLAACDFMTSQTMSTGDACHFDFQHLGSVMRVECRMNTDCTLTALTLTAEKDAFVNTATMDVTRGTLTPLTHTGVMTLKLDNVVVSRGETFTAYMMLPPADLTGQTLTLTLSSSYSEIFATEVKGTEILPGRLYPLTIEMPVMEEDEDDVGDDEESAEEYELQFVTPVLAAAKETIIKVPTAFAPAFVADNTHHLEQIVKPEEESAIAANKAPTKQRQQAFSILGMKAGRTARGNVIISNGRKYMSPDSGTRRQ